MLCTLSCAALPCCNSGLLCRTTFASARLCCAVCCAVLCCAVPCRAILCRAVLTCATVCCSAFGCGVPILAVLCRPNGISTVPTIADPLPPAPNTAAQGKYARQAGVALGLSADATIAGYRYHGLRSQQIFSIFETVFGAAQVRGQAPLHQGSASLPCKPTDPAQSSRGLACGPAGADCKQALLVRLLWLLPSPPYAASPQLQV
jgi:hypothetical protein